MFNWFHMHVSGLTHDHWQKVSVLLELPAGNLTVSVSDKTIRSVHLPDETTDVMTEFFNGETDRTATVFLGGEYKYMVFFSWDLTYPQPFLNTGAFQGSSYTFP